MFCLNFYEPPGKVYPNVGCRSAKTPGGQGAMALWTACIWRWHSFPQGRTTMRPGRLVGHEGGPGLKFGMSAYIGGCWDHAGGAGLFCLNLTTTVSWSAANGGCRSARTPGGRRVTALRTACIWRRHSFPQGRTTKWPERLVGYEGGSGLNLGCRRASAALGRNLAVRACSA